MKWLLIVPAVLIGGALILWFGMLAYFSLLGNKSVAAELHENPSGERAKIVALLTFPDGRELPANYLREGDTVFIGADGPWWRAFRDGNVSVRLLIQGETLTRRARTILDDPDYTKSVFARLRPTAPSWLPDWLNARLIVIDLDAQA